MLTRTPCLLWPVQVLLGGASTWLLGAECLAWCPVYGADTLEAVLDKSPVRTAVCGQLCCMCEHSHVAEGSAKPGVLV